MTAQIIGLATAVGLVVPASLGQVSTTSAAAAQFFVTGYVLRGYTATGTYVHPGTCAVDPRVIPLGSYIRIAGLGTCHAEDTGGLIIGYRIDVWVSTVAQAYALTGWHTASWGPRPTQRVPGSPASQRQSPVPTPKRAPRRQADQRTPAASTGTAMAARYAPRVTRATARAICCAATLSPSSAAMGKTAIASIGRLALPAASPSTRR
jgi:3D (Asp-Asp-Asp) domain-containing protein